MNPNVLKSSQAVESVEPGGEVNVDVDTVAKVIVGLNSSNRQKIQDLLERLARDEQEMRRGSGSTYHDSVE